MSTFGSDAQSQDSLVEDIKQSIGALDAAPSIHDGIRSRIKVAMAIDLILLSELPLSRAAELAGVPPYELAIALQARGIPAERYLGHAPPVEEPDSRVEPLKLTVVMPCYNELKTIQEILRRVRAVEIPKEIIVVDDCSKDGTRDLLRQEIDGQYDDVRVIYHEKNQGKGAALRTGFQHATGNILLIQDADLEYNPQEYYRLVQPILEGRADVVYGSRFAGGSHRVHLYWHAVGNRFLTMLSNMVTNLNLTDMETCYKVFRADILEGLTIQQNRFGFEPEITAKIAKRRVRVYEVPISYHGRDYAEGKKIGWKDGFQALWCIMKYRFSD